jgi:hypothetical protein
MLAAALDLAARGFAVFPLAPRSKVPMLSREQGGRGCLDATREINRIACWWSRWPLCNIGLATGPVSGLYVVDVDAGKGGRETMQVLTAKHGRIPDTLRSRTGSGWHIFFRWPQSPVRQGNNVLGPGVDTRGTGGYVVAPPSVHPSGRRYMWLADLEPAPLPDWIAQLAAPLPAPPPIVLPRREDGCGVLVRARRWLAEVPGAVSGQQGHRQTFHVACGLVRGFMLDADTALALLLADYNPRCEPPWRQKDLVHKVRSAERCSSRPLGYLLNAPRRAA